MLISLRPLLGRRGRCAALAAAAALVGALVLAAPAARAADDDPLTVSPSPLDLGTLPAGGYSDQQVGRDEQEVTFTNTSASDVALADLVHTGTLEWSLGQGRTCWDPTRNGWRVLHPHDSCSITIDWHAPRTGPMSGTLAWRTQDGRTVGTVAVSGTGVVGVSPSWTPVFADSAVVGEQSTWFAQVQPVEGVSPSERFTVTASVPAGPFSIDGPPTCRDWDLHNSVCVVHGLFAPTTVGVVRSTVTITARDLDGNHLGTIQVPISGDGLGPQVSVSPNPVDLGKVPVGDRATRTVRLSNTGAGDEVITFGRVTGPFTIEPGRCANRTLQPGHVCRFRATFEPTSTGPRTGTVTVISSRAGATTVTLRGVGTARALPTSPRTSPPAGPSAAPPAPSAPPAAAGGQPPLAGTGAGDVPGGLLAGVALIAVGLVLTGAARRRRS